MKFEQDKKDHLILKLQQYFEHELSIELGQFDADFLLDFISDEMGSYFYNQGLQDAQQLMHERLQLISEEIVQLEKPTN
ncbi:DUF2164 domain-containing protein [Thalassotalea ganghwensis]